MQTSVFVFPGVLDGISISTKDGSGLSYSDLEAIELIAENEELNREDRRVANRILWGVRRGIFTVAGDNDNAA